MVTGYCGAVRRPVHPFEQHNVPFRQVAEPASEADGVQAANEWRQWRSVSVGHSVSSRKSMRPLLEFKGVSNVYRHFLATPGALHLQHQSKIS
jgi:hypothetical protein